MPAKAFCEDLVIAIVTQYLKVMTHMSMCHPFNLPHQHLFALPGVKYQFLARHKDEYSITLMCQALEVSVSG